jgi:hypothetical protein
MEIPKIHCNVCHRQMTMTVDETEKSLWLVGFAVNLDRIEATREAKSGRGWVHVCDDCCEVLKVVLAPQRQKAS